MLPLASELVVEAAIVWLLERIPLVRIAGRSQLIFVNVARSPHLESSITAQWLKIFRCQLNNRYRTHLRSRIPRSQCRLDPRFLIRNSGETN